MFQGIARVDLGGTLEYISGTVPGNTKERVMTIYRSKFRTEIRFGAWVYKSRKRNGKRITWEISKWY